MYTYSLNYYNTTPSQVNFDYKMSYKIYAYLLLIISVIFCSSVKPLPSDLESSNILKKEAAYVHQLKKWLGEKCKWNLCYRASRDGWKGTDFHKHCDHKGPTVVLIRANDCIFGGYTDKDWGGMHLF